MLVLRSHFSMRSALDLLQTAKSRPRYISFGCPVLDEVIGGVSRVGITEICGEAGTGKTQICLILALQAVLQKARTGSEGSAAIMSCGEGLFPIRRLSQLAQTYASANATATQGMTADEFLGRIHIEECPNTDQAIDTVFKKLPEMCQRLKLQILVIDSLAGLVRFEYDRRSTTQMLDRTALLFNISRQLKWLSDTFDVAVVVVNQVSAGTSIERRDSGMGLLGESSPALGLAWAHCANTRIMLERQGGPSTYLSAEEAKAGTHGGPTSACDEEPPRKRGARSRGMRLVTSPSRPTAAVHYDITAEGVVGLHC